MQENIGCINICKGKPITLRTLVEYWISKKGGDIKLLLGIYPDRDYEPKCFWGDRSYLNETLKKTYNNGFCNE
jgi:dTDP-6-deoxy-L-talose 4-dehydrogenase (NAD+)